MQNGEFEFHFQNASLPPPFASQLIIFLKNKGKKVFVDFDQEYLYRDEISEDEVLHAGFPPEEEYKWKGNLPSIWFEASLKLPTPVKMILSDLLMTSGSFVIW